MADPKEKFSCISSVAKIWPDVTFEHPVQVNDYSEVRTGSRIGAFSFINFRSTIHRNVSIGRFCSIAEDTNLGAGDHPLHFLSTHSFQYPSVLFPDYPDYRDVRHAEWQTYLPTTIENDVWVGAKAVIRAGISIGNGAVVAAGAVVVSDVPPYAIVGGVPARLIRHRFSNDIIGDLMELKWWELPLSCLRDLPFDDVKSCIIRLRELRNDVGDSRKMDPQPHTGSAARARFQMTDS